MSMFSRRNTDLYRYTHDGLRVYGVPVLLGRGPKWCVVSDAAAPLLEQRLRVYSVLSFATIIVVAPLVSMNAAEWLWLLMVPLIHAIGLHFWLRRTLPRAFVSSSDLVPVNRRARDLAEAQSMGEPVLWILFVAAIAMASLDLVVLFTSGDWWAWFGLLMFGACAVMMARGIRIVRRTRRGTVQPPAA